MMISGASVIRKCGAGLRNSISGATYTDDFISQAESFVNNATRFDWSTAYAALAAEVKHTLTEAVSNLAAIYMINYDMGGYTSRTEAEIMINVLKQRADECIAVLIDKKGETFATST